MKIKKLDIYKMEFKIVFMIVIGLISSDIGVLLIDFIGRVIKNILQLSNMQYPSVLTSTISRFGKIEFVLILIIYFHIACRKKVIAFLEMNSIVKDMANGNFKIRINNNSEDELGRLSQNINKVMNKFSLVLEQEKKAEQTKIDLITSVSYDLRAPVTSILKNLNFVDEDEFTIRSYVNMALVKTKKLKVLIDDLFELTTLNNYGTKISKNKINIVELLKQMIIEHKANFKKANIECRLNMIDEKLHVLGDSNKLVRAFENLIFNCVKYSKRSEFIDISVARAASKVILEFTNYGQSIPPMDIPYIFQRFYRTNKREDNENSGSGLELAITKNIVELHDGKISVESNILKTTFRIELPCLE
ncbi:sensor histidine kinase [Clostridium neuense]|uniref:histidine kinase n=1 Tax=Clostridium neuense TaxID=1728934 RepID=A0ABW8TKW0_9CLOT